VSIFALSISASLFADRSTRHQFLGALILLLRVIVVGLFDIDLSQWRSRRLSSASWICVRAPDGVCASSADVSMRATTWPASIVSPSLKRTSLTRPGYFVAT
jgi:hypothetical protein